MTPDCHFYLHWGRAFEDPPGNRGGKPRESPDEAQAGVPFFEVADPTGTINISPEGLRGPDTHTPGP
jgi:hypothetical protein